MKAAIKNTHWNLYNTQHDVKRGQAPSFIFNIVITVTTILMLVSGQ